jgi:hypothetical protein
MILYAITLALVRYLKIIIRTTNRDDSETTMSVRYSLHAVTLVEDDEGKRPLEHAIVSDASIQTEKLLQHATRVGMMKINQMCLEQSEDKQ